jgi:hypothetical protein
MGTKPLGDSSVFPTNDVLEKVLGKIYPVYENLMEAIAVPEIGLVHEWRFYKDGNSWLCKVSFKKKTVFWLSVWDKYFQIGFYFTEKTRAGIMELPIDDNLKSKFGKTKTLGKLVPLPIQVTRKKQIKDVIELVKYKKSLK